MNKCARNPDKQNGLKFDELAQADLASELADYVEHSNKEAVIEALEEIKNFIKPSCKGIYFDKHARYKFQCSYYLLQFCKKLAELKGAKK
jgi:hypothetical protein